MKNKYSCFIENTAEAREWLESIGYERYVYTVCPDDYDIIITTEDGFYLLFMNKALEKVDHSMDTPCLGNLELFKALTAVRDDSDYMQYFTDGKHWEFCDREDWIDMYSVLCSGGRYNYNKKGELDKFHKATKEELIKRFKK